MNTTVNGLIPLCGVEREYKDRVLAKHVASALV